MKRKGWKKIKEGKKYEIFICYSLSYSLFIIMFRHCLPFSFFSAIPESECERQRITYLLFAKNREKSTRIWEWEYSTVIINIMMLANEWTKWGQLFVSWSINDIVGNGRKKFSSFNSPRYILPGDKSTFSDFTNITAEWQNENVEKFSLSLTHLKKKKNWKVIFIHATTQIQAS